MVEPSEADLLGQYYAQLDPSGQSQMGGTFPRIRIHGGKSEACIHGLTWRPMPVIPVQPTTEAETSGGLLPPEQTTYLGHWRWEMGAHWELTGSSMGALWELSGSSLQLRVSFS